MQAQELESSLGGVYSRLAVDLQLPLAAWLLMEIDVSLAGTKLNPTIVTGLDALSRASDGQQLAGLLSDLASLSSLPQQALMWINFRAVITDLAAARGIPASRYVKEEQQVQAELQQAQQAQADQAANQAVATEGAKAINQG